MATKTAKKLTGPRTHNLNTRPEDGCLEMADELVELVSKEKGVSVKRPDVVKIALEEALASRRGKGKR